MQAWKRSWITTIVAWVAVVFIGGAAIAGVGARSAKEDKQKDNKKPDVAASESPEATETKDVEIENGTEKADNHGQCVSTWAHKAKEGIDGGDPLEGRYFGGFVSTVAQSDETGADCDMTEEYEEWLAKQEAAATEESSDASTQQHGKSGQKHGRGNGSTDDGDTEVSGS